MLTVGDILADQLHHPFVGREAELQAMRAELTSGDWRMLHLWGGGGTGKTALLRAFLQQGPWPRALWLRLAHRDGMGYEVRVEPAAGAGASFASRLDELPERLCDVALGPEGHLLIIDDFNAWAPLFDWLRQVLLPALPATVRVCTASRSPLGPDWTREAPWSHVLRQLQLQPLDQRASFQLLRALGLEDFETCHTLCKAACGLPGALVQLGRDALIFGLAHVQSTPYQRQFCSALAQELLREAALTDAELNLLDAATLLWDFNLDSLSQVLEQPIGISAFHRFCTHSFVEAAAMGWRISQPVRHWVRRAFMYRAPDRYAACRSRAKQYWLSKLEHADPDLRRSIYINLLYLTENETLHTYCFQESLDRFQLRPLPKQDLPLVKQMFIAFHEVVPAFLQDRTHQEEYLEAYWALSPETFFGFYDGSELAMFMSMLPLSPEVRYVLRENPVYRAYIQQTAESEPDTIMWIASFRPEYGASAVGLVFLLGFAELAGRSRMVVMSPFLEAQRLNQAVGHERLEWADYTAGNGLVYQAFRLDLTDPDVLDGLLRSGRNGHRTDAPPLVEPAQAVAHIRELLAHFHDFENVPAVVSRCPWLQSRCHSRQELHRAAEALRRFLSATIDRWASGSGAAPLCGEILNLRYVKRAGTHERIADRLNLSLSTYYRHLKKATAMLAEAYRAQLSVGFDRPEVTS